MNKHILRWAVLLVLLLAPCSAMGAAPDVTVYASLLARYVRDGRVDYAGLKTQEKELAAALYAMGQVVPETLSPKDQFAYYINIYNAWTLKLILDHYPGIRSIKDAGSLLRSPWKQEFVQLHDSIVSLDTIEHGILRRRFHDPRLHFAVNCASKSCPPLVGVPYSGENLDAQLDTAARNFINAPNNTYFKDGVLHVSRLFTWYDEDFGGETGVWTFVRRFADPPLTRQMDATGQHRLAYDAYDWSLNGK